MSTRTRMARASRPLSGVSDEVLRDANVGGAHEDGATQEGVPLDRGGTGGMDESGVHDDMRRAQVGRGVTTGDIRGGTGGIDESGVHGDMRRAQVAEVYYTGGRHFPLPS